jgi:hypothetical protein
VSYDFPDAKALLPTIAEHIQRLRDGLGPLAAARNVGVGLATPFLLGGWHRTLGLSKAQSDAVEPDRPARRGARAQRGAGELRARHRGRLRGRAGERPGMI